MDIVFGAICLALFIFFLMPPVGFVWVDKAPYTAGILFKRVFNFFYGAIMPWFILLYTGYKKKLLPVVISALYLTGYMIMVFTVNESISPHILAMHPSTLRSRMKKLNISRRVS